MDIEKEGYAETLLNMIMDEIDDIILIHDSEHTVVWINRAGLKAFGISLEKTIGKRCYSLFGKSSCCEDCNVPSMTGMCVSGASIKIIPNTGEKYVCTSMPLYSGNEIKLVVQHLSKISSN